MTGIASLLRSLDLRLLRLVERSRLHNQQPFDPFRSLCVSEEEVLQALAPAQEPLASLPALSLPESFLQLGEMYSLSHFELELLAVSLAPEFDSRYERAFGYLQDDINRTRPSIDLLFRVLDAGIAARSYLRPGSKLLRRQIVRLSGDETTNFPRREVVPDLRIASFLLGDSNIDPRISPFALLLPPTNPEMQSSDPGLVRLLRSASENKSSLVVYLQGTNEQEKRAAAAAAASTLGASLLIVELDRAAAAVPDMQEWLGDVAREAFLQDAIVYRTGLDGIAGEQTRALVLRELASERGISLLSGTAAWHAGDSGLNGVVTIPFEMPGWTARRQAWKASLDAFEVPIEGCSLDLLAECFRFDRNQIRDAAQTARNLAVYRNESAGLEHLFEAARSRSGRELAALARKVNAVYSWNELVLPEDALAQLHEICDRVTSRHQVIGEWGFGRKLSGGKGVNALFYGHSGTGKTMAAEVIATELRLDLFKIDLAGVVSKYIGETEKNLDRIFSAAETANAILFFDEADALFGKRSEVKDSHDRYANLEISYLLQKMEAYEGVAILATNLRQNLDDAFVRRLAFMITFPFPDEASRRRIWQGIWPAAAPLDPDVDLDYLAATFKLSGGNIRNVALAAAFQAAEARSPITMRLVLDATRREFQKLGKNFGSGELSVAFDRRTSLEATA